MTEIVRPRRPELNCTTPRRVAEIELSRPMGTAARAAEADAAARAEAGPALADDDLAAVHRLAGEDLDAEVFRVGVAAVPARSESLLMSHLRLPPSSRPTSRLCSKRPAFD